MSITLVMFPVEESDETVRRATELLEQNATHQRLVYGSDQLAELGDFLLKEARLLRTVIRYADLGRVDLASMAEKEANENKNQFLQQWSYLGGCLS